MSKKLVVLGLIGAFLVSGCSSEPKAIEEFYNQLYLEVDSQLNDGYTEAQLSALVPGQQTYEYFSIVYEKVDLLAQNLKIKANAALDQASDSEKEILNELIKIYSSYSSDSQNAIKLLRNYEKECPDTASRPKGSLPTHECGEIFFNAFGLKETSLVCVYYVTREISYKFSRFR